MRTCHIRARQRALAALAFFGLAALCAGRASAQNAELAASADKELPSLVAFYTDLHLHPELSHFEVRTAAKLAQELRVLGFEVTENVGRYPWGAGAHGIVAIMKNGPGPTVLVRSDLDALPVEEKTGLPYASKARMKNDAGQEVPVMHACGHDVHVASLVGTARLLAARKDRWHGTLMLVGQPSEETIDGALAMLNDRLYERFPKPDYLLALHDYSNQPTGKVGVTSGFAFAMSTQMDIVVRGIGAHGSQPNKGKDPVVLAAAIVMRLQTIVSREMSPFDPAVVTVGTIHGGLKRNIIPDEVKLELNLRSYTEPVRQHLIDAIRRIAKGEAIAAGVPEERMPIVTVLENEYAPALYNEPALVERAMAAMAKALGAQNVEKLPSVMGSEDFGQLGLNGQLPTLMFRVGAVDPARFAAAQASGTALPTEHSPLFAPVPGATIRTGVIAMTSVVLDLLH
jgi:amidohydrolase